ncbi:DUF4348 domain-containing protein [Niastella sp. OAS944]|uniref:DUF4348 domain-containing protein n=1 Tax=Niastella sp. OAS944 TaxID=2664089 RepID=UPI003489A95B|nr:hypothetical protein [Chitinophagaceae bacterium OAS944]
MKTPTILLAAFLITGCSEESKKPEQPTAQTNHAQAESFDSFFEKFSSDSVFQKSRIKFPLTSQVYDIDSEKEVTSTTDASEWAFFNIKQLKQDKKYIFKTSSEKEQYIINVKMEDTGIYVDYIFDRQSGKWTLVKIVDQST